MVLDKMIIQEEVEKTIKNGKYTEGLGKVILLFADVSAHRRGLHYRFSEFEIDFIIKPRIVDSLLLKVFKYKKDRASAYAFFALITTSAITDAIKDLRKAAKWESKNIFYLEDMKREIMSLDNTEEFVSGEIYIQDNQIKYR